MIMKAHYIDNIIITSDTTIVAVSENHRNYQDHAHSRHINPTNPNLCT